MANYDKLNNKVQEDIVKSIKAGCFIETACSLAGISKATIYSWMKKGETEKEGKYRNFYLEVEKASAMAETRAVALITKSASLNWKAAAWFLQHRYPDRWKTKIEVDNISDKELEERQKEIDNYIENVMNKNEVKCRKTKQSE